MKQLKTIGILLLCFLFIPVIFVSIGNYHDPANQVLYLVLALLAFFFYLVRKYQIKKQVSLVKDLFLFGGSVIGSVSLWYVLVVMNPWLRLGCEACTGTGLAEGIRLLWVSVLGLPFVLCFGCGVYFLLRKKLFN